MKRKFVVALLLVALVAALALLPMAGQSAYQTGYTPDGFYWCGGPRC